MHVFVSRIYGFTLCESDLSAAGIQKLKYVAACAHHGRDVTSAEPLDGTTWRNVRRTGEQSYIHRSLALGMHFLWFDEKEAG